LTLAAEDRRSFASFRESYEAAKSSLIHLINSLQLDLQRIPLDPDDGMSVGAVVETVMGWRKSPERITRWIAFMGRIRIAQEHGLGSLTEGILNGSLSDAALAPTFERSYFEAMRSLIFANNPELRRFDGEAHGRLVEFPPAGRRTHAALTRSNRSRTCIPPAAEWRRHRPARRA
jgi:hypothetical protein